MAAPEALMLAHGFTVLLLVDLVIGGLASAHPNRQQDQAILHYTKPQNE